jgi:uncharacterized delta-60 repeat protein
MRRTTMLALLMSVAGLVITSAASAQAGQLDTAFGGDGRVATDVTARGDMGTTVAVQADGKIVVAGGAGWNRNPRFVLVRYNADGTLDTSFGGDGRVTTDFTPAEDAAWGIAIQADGKIVAAGDAALGTGNSRFAVARYNADGTLDTSFGGDGKVTTQFTRRDDPVAGLAMQPDGKIVVSGGAAYDGPNPNFALARYNSDGTLDTSFGGDGKVTTDFVGRHDFANAVAIQADGKVVAGGLAGFSRRRGRAQFGLARYNADGTPDTAFSGDGKLTTNFTRGNDSVQGVAIQSDGSIVTVGIAAFNSSNATFALARYTQNGTLDASFGGDGKVRTAFNRSAAYAYDVVLQPDGKIVAGGVAAGRGGRFAIARYGTRGALDATFSGDGRAMTNFTTRNDFAYGLAQQADGNLVLAGGSDWGGSNPKVAVARYLGA